MIVTIVDTLVTVLGTEESQSGAPGEHAAAGRAVREGAAVLAVAGGDGTIGAVAQVALDNDTPLIVVPCGTRNHFASRTGRRPSRSATSI